MLGGHLQCANCRGHPQQVTGDTKLGGAADKPGSHGSIQRDLQVGEMGRQKPPDIHPGECKIWSLGRTAPALVCGVHPRAEQAQGALINVYKHLKAGCKVDRAWLFPVVPSGRTRHHRHKLECWGFPLHIRNTFFPTRLTKS